MQRVTREEQDISFADVVILVLYISYYFKTPTEGNVYSKNYKGKTLFSLSKGLESPRIIYLVPFRFNQDFILLKENTIHFPGASPDRQSFQTRYSVNV